MSDNTATKDAPVDDLVGRLADEFLERLRQGEKPDIEEYAKDHPEIANVIRQVFPSLDILGESKLSVSPNGSGGGDYQQGVLGDYRIVRELGRGGMGVVYEAEQISLDRRVALKVLPFAAVLDERQVRRFRNEARAAAQLKHPNIVQVFGVGCERSVHFYAMEYVEGESFSEVIADLRRLEGIDDEPVPDGSLAESLASGEFNTAGSSCNLSGRAEDSTRSPKASLTMETSTRSNHYFRSVARLSLQIAEALEHAHQEGIIHRDIKPSNLMIDAQGKASVTDFGLARIETDAALTMTGDLVGTMRYMSPEQALAKRVVVDQRTDTYSLGVTLYELLTLRPAFPQDEQQELLKAIAFEEPTRPKRLNPKLPEDLETIARKAIEKNPNDRYESSQEFADDLRRYLDDEPIHAKRPSVLQVGKKWAKRHATGVKFTIAALILAIITGVSALAYNNNIKLGLLAQALGLLNEVGSANVEIGEYKRAETYLEQAYLHYSEGVPCSAENLLQLRCDLAKVRFELDNPQGALDALEVAAKQPFGFRGTDYDTAYRAKELLASIYYEVGRAPEALPLLDSLVKHKASIHRADDRRVLFARLQLADALSRSGQHERAKNEVIDVFEKPTLFSYPRDSPMMDRVFRLVQNVRYRAGDTSQRTRIYDHIYRRCVASHDSWNAAKLVGHQLLLLGACEDMRKELLFTHFRFCVEQQGGAAVYGPAPLIEYYETYYNDYRSAIDDKPQYLGLEYDGRTSETVIPTIHFDGDAPWTLEAIATITKPVGVVENDSMLVSSTNGGGLAIGFHDGKWSLWLRDKETGDPSRLYSIYTIARSKHPVRYGQRQHIAGVWVDNEIRLYVNGQLQERLPVDSKSAKKWLHLNPFMIGVDPGVSCTAQYEFFHGVMESVRISKAEIYRESFTPPEELTPVDGTIGQYDFRYKIKDYTPDDPRLCGFVFDRSGNGNHAWVANTKYAEAESGEP